MFERLSAIIADRFLELKVISSDDYELYRYGIQQGFILLLNILSVMVISLILGMVTECIVFLLSYVPLRSYAGGFHAKTHARCYVFSLIIITGILLAMRLLSIPAWLYMLLAVFGVIMIVLFAPVEDANKPLDEVEQIVYRKRTLLILLLTVIGMILSIVFQAYLSFSAIAFAICLLGILLIAGRVKNNVKDSHLF